jgi:tetratricopeptide (TPR) repeat protein
LRCIGYAISVTDDDIKLFITLSKIQRAMGDFEGAYSSIQKANSIFQDASDFNMAIPEDITRQTNLIFNEMAIKYATDGDYERAIVLFNKAIASEKALSRGLTPIDFR